MKKLATFVLSAVASAHAGAATVSDQFDVTATVVSACTVTATDIAFGNYDPLAALPLDATGTVSVRCSLLAPFNIGLDEGAGSGSTVTNRQMTLASDTETLVYGLYTNLLRTTNWGKTVGTDTVTGIGTGLAVPYIVYGRVNAGQNQPVGSYSDTITVTITY